MRLIRTALIVLWAISFAACNSGDNDADAGSNGAIEIVGGWIGELPPGSLPKAAFFECPFNMPPEQTAGGNIEGDQARIAFDDVPAGDWCVLAYLDVDEGDGLMPVDGVDWVAYPASGESFPITVESGKTTVLELTFERRVTSPE